MMHARDKTGRGIETLLRQVEERSQETRWAVSIGIGLGALVVAAGLAVFVLVLFVLTQIFA